MIVQRYTECMKEQHTLFLRRKKRSLEAAYYELVRADAEARKNEESISCDSPPLLGKYDSRAASCDSSPPLLGKYDSRATVDDYPSSSSCVVEPLLADADDYPGSSEASADSENEELLVSGPQSAPKTSSAAENEQKSCRAVVKFQVSVSQHGP